jgi:hypothetical protein
VNRLQSMKWPENKNSPLIRWSSIPEKFVVSQLIKKFPHFMEPEGLLPSS